MTFVIGSACIDTMDRSCVDVCPVDCIYEGGRKLYIQPEECIDCGACEDVCPVSAVRGLDDLASGEEIFIDDSRRFFDDVLPGRDSAIGSPRGARDVGPIGTDTELVRTHVATVSVAT